MQCVVCGGLLKQGSSIESLVSGGKNVKFHLQDTLVQHPKQCSTQRCQLVCKEAWHKHTRRELLACATLRQRELQSFRLQRQTGNTPPPKGTKSVLSLVMVLGGVGIITHIQTNRIIIIGMLITATLINIALLSFLTKILLTFLILRIDKNLIHITVIQHNAF